MASGCNHESGLGVGVVGFSVAYRGRSEFDEVGGSTGEQRLTFSQISRKMIPDLAHQISHNTAAAGDATSGA